MSFAEQLSQINSNITKNECGPDEKLKLATLERYNDFKASCLQASRSGKNNMRGSFYDIDYKWNNGAYSSYKHWANVNWIEADNPFFKSKQTATCVKNYIENSLQKDGFKSFSVTVRKSPASTFLNALFSVEVDVKW